MNLIDLYKKKDGDVAYPLIGVNGFTLVSYYPEGIENRKIFIRLYEEGDNHAIYAKVDMVEERNKSGLMYVLVEPRISGRWYTNFYVEKDDNLVFDSSTGFINNTLNKTNYTIDQFVDLLIKNHTRDVFFMNRLNSNIKLTFLKFLFFLVNEDLEKSPFEVHLRSKKDEVNKNIKLEQEPFYKYFEVPKNLFMMTMILLIIILPILKKFGHDFVDVTPSFVIGLYSLTAFFFLELFAKYIRNKINEFYSRSEDRKSNWITRLYNSIFQKRVKFTLK